MNTAADSINPELWKAGSVSEDGPTNAASRTQRLTSMAVLGAAVLVALGVTSYLLLSSDDDTPPAGGDGLVTPIPNLPGAPTPMAGTGVLEPNRPKAGEAAPNFALPDARDPSQIRQLTDYRGKVVVLNFWATWCGPCKKEIPEFQAAQQALGDDVVVLALNYRESPDKASAFLADLEATFPALLDGGGKVAEHYRVSGLPVTYFLDREGIVQHIEIGEVSLEELEKYLTEAGAPYAAAD
ncbi:MAG: TlpA disulfide reductase family protein [Dehalococcoidia bacterium]